MAINYVKAAATALRLITANGGAVSLVKLDRVPADSAKPWRAGGVTDTTVVAQAVLLSYDETDVDGDIVRRGDRKALVAFTGVGGADILLFDNLIDQNSGKWRIENINLLDPTGANGILYTLQLRR